MKMKLQILPFLLFCVTSYAQPVSDTTAAESIKKQKTKKVTSFFKEHLDINGYLQFQWNYITKPDSIASNSSSGGYFDRGINNRFTLRRGRLAVQYSDKYSEVKIQADLNERGLFLNDFYGKIKDPWLDVFAFTGGIFERPFGYELSYSSRYRETPERAMVIQTLFPNTRDLGAMLTVKAPDSSKANGLKFNIAVFGGNSGKSETNYKDVVAQLRYDRNFGKKQQFHIGLGVSGLYGNIRHTYDIGSSDPQGQKYIYKFGYTDTSYTKGFLVDSAKSYAAGRYGGKVPKFYFNADIEFGVKWKLGETKVSTEFTSGKQVSKEQNLVNLYTFTSMSPTGLQPGVIWSFFNAPNSYNPALIKQLDGPAHTFIRTFNGGHVTFVHTFNKPKIFITFRYEWYDPNDHVKGSQIKMVDRNGMNSYITPADVRYEIFQVGAGYNFTKKIRMSFHYDRIRNEKTMIEAVPFDNSLINASFIYPNAGWKDNIKDDVVTLRLQIGF